MQVGLKPIVILYFNHYLVISGAANSLPGFRRSNRQIKKRGSESASPVNPQFGQPVPPLISATGFYTTCFSTSFCHSSQKEFIKKLIAFSITVRRSEFREKVVIVIVLFDAGYLFRAQSIEVGGAAFLFLFIIVFRIDTVQLFISLKSAGRFVIKVIFGLLSIRWQIFRSTNSS